MDINDFVNMKDHWFGFGDLGFCEIPGCHQLVTKHIAIKMPYGGIEEFYFCHDHFNEIVHRMTYANIVKKEDKNA